MGVPRRAAHDAGEAHEREAPQREVGVVAEGPPAEEICHRHVDEACGRAGLDQRLARAEVHDADMGEGRFRIDAVDGVARKADAPKDLAAAGDVPFHIARKAVAGALGRRGERDGGDDPDLRADARVAHGKVGGDHPGEGRVVVGRLDQDAKGFGGDEAGGALRPREARDRIDGDVVHDARGAGGGAGGGLVRSEAAVVEGEAQVEAAVELAARQVGLAHRDGVVDLEEVQLPVSRAEGEDGVRGALVHEDLVLAGGLEDGAAHPERIRRAERAERVDDVLDERAQSRGRMR